MTQAEFSQFSELVVGLAEGYKHSMSMVEAYLFVSSRKHFIGSSQFQIRTRSMVP